MLVSLWTTILLWKISPILEGRRGVSGTIFVHKIQGHAAREGKSLADIKALADKIVPNIHTIGLTLSGATVPEVGKPSFILAEDEIEYGIGIHGEPGYRKESMQLYRQLAEELIGKLLEAFEAKSGERYALFSSMVWVRDLSWSSMFLLMM